MSRFQPAIVVGTLFLALACSGKKESSDRQLTISASTDSGAPVTVSMSAAKAEASVDAGEDRVAGGPTFAEGPDGSISMKTRGGALVMLLRHDSVLVAFSDSMRRMVRHEVDSSMSADKDKDDSGLGGIIKGVVETTVSTTLREVFDKARGFPVSLLSDARYKDGAMEFDYKTKPKFTFDDLKEGDESLLQKFYPSDAARFVGAVRARIRQN